MIQSFLLKQDVDESSWASVAKGIAFENSILGHLTSSDARMSTFTIRLIVSGFSLLNRSSPVRFSSKSVQRHDVAISFMIKWVRIPSASFLSRGARCKIIFNLLFECAWINLKVSSDKLLENRSTTNFSSRSQQIHQYIALAASLLSGWRLNRVNTEQSKLMSVQSWFLWIG